MGGMDVKGGSGVRRATLKDVAAELGVAPSTVSNAYNRPDQLSEELRERVFEVARRLGYSGPDPVARGLRRRRAGAVGVLYPDRLSYAFADPAAVLFMEGVSRATEEAGLGLLLIPGSSPEELGRGMIGGAMVDGFIVFSMPADGPLIEAVLERHLPAVLVDQFPSQDVPRVGIDDEEAAKLAAKHLIKLGHRSFGAMSLELTLDTEGGLAGLGEQQAATYWPSRARLQGYSAALEEAGLPWAEVPVYEITENTQEQGRIAAGFLLSRNFRPTAILAMSDRLALGAFEAAKDVGLSVPEDLSVVGFDDVPEAARATPPLTTVHQPHVEKGYRAGRLLIAQLRKEEPEESPILPTRLVIRGSTAPPKA